MHKCQADTKDRWLLFRVRKYRLWGPSSFPLMHYQFNSLTPFCPFKPPTSSPPSPQSNPTNSKLISFSLSLSLSLTLTKKQQQQQHQRQQTTMVVASQPALNHSSLIKTCKPTSLFTGIPVVDLSDPEAKSLIVKAFEEFGIFKLVNHGIPMEVITRLEVESLRFFNLPQSDKDRAGPPDPFGYGSKRIGPNGDVGWIEYILLNTNPDVMSHKSLSIFQQSPEIFR